MIVPKTIDSGLAVPLPYALFVDFVLILLFAIQHSVMARNSSDGGHNSCGNRSNAAPMCCFQVSLSCAGLAMASDPGRGLAD